MGGCRCPYICDGRLLRVRVCLCVPLCAGVGMGVGGWVGACDLAPSHSGGSLPKHFLAKTAFREGAAGEKTREATEDGASFRDIGLEAPEG